MRRKFFFFFREKTFRGRAENGKIITFAVFSHYSYNSEPAEGSMRSAARGFGPQHVPWRDLLDKLCDFAHLNNAKMPDVTLRPLGALTPLGRQFLRANGRTVRLYIL